MSTESPTCPTCNVPLTDHGGIAVTCAEVQRLRSRLASIRETLEQIVNVIDSTDTYFVDMTDSEMAESVIAELWEVTLADAIIDERKRLRAAKRKEPT